MSRLRRVWDGPGWTEAEAAEALRREHDNFVQYYPAMAAVGLRPDMNYLEMLEHVCRVMITRGAA